MNVPNYFKGRNKRLHEPHATRGQHVVQTWFTTFEQSLFNIVRIFFLKTSRVETKLCFQKKNETKQTVSETKFCF